MYLLHLPGESRLKLEIGVCGRLLEDPLLGCNELEVMALLECELRSAEKLDVDEEWVLLCKD